MGYLIANDYNRLIQDVNLQQLISGNPQLKPQAEVAAMAEARSYLTKKYDVDQEFTNTAKYSPTATYKATNRVYLDAPYYNEKATYALNDLVLKMGKVYQCTTIVPTAEDFDAGKWLELGAQFSFFYAITPADVFNIEGTYSKDDEVFWKDKVYTCIIPTAVISQDAKIQYSSTTNIPSGNVFPDDPVNGVKYWGAGTAYEVPAGKLLEVEDGVPVYFNPGDNRNQQMVTFLLDIIIYNLYRRIPPAIVPDIRIMAYQQAKSWFKNVSTGDEVIADLVKKQPKAGGRIMSGSRPKQDNWY